VKAGYIGLQFSCTDHNSSCMCPFTNRSCRSY